MLWSISMIYGDREDHDKANLLQIKKGYHILYHIARMLNHITIAFCHTGIYAGSRPDNDSDFILTFSPK